MARISAAMGRGDTEASYMSVRYEDIISPNKKKDIGRGEPTRSIRQKLREGGDGLESV